VAAAHASSLVQVMGDPDKGSFLRGISIEPGLYQRFDLPG
jgi:hypothetical protein